VEPAGLRGAGAASRYEILGHLATGGMAELYLVRPTGAPAARPVVLKRIMADYSRNPRFVAMFLDEARLAAQLDHPNVARVLDIGRVGDAPFFTMEYVHGENVRDILQRVARRGGRIPLEHVLTIAIGAAAGLHHAHERPGPDGRPLEIVHRDVSPSNLMVSYAGEVKVLDFGIAKAADRSAETRTGAVKGKVAYMSPEQCTGQPLDRTSDVFALGIILFEMATMTRLFRHASDFETMNHIVNLPLPSPRARRPDLPPALADIIVRALARRPEDRFATAGELAAALEVYAVRAGVTLAPAALGGYLHQLFGARPEPWLALDAARAREEREDAGDAAEDVDDQDADDRIARISSVPMAEDPPTGQRRLPGYSAPPGDWEPIEPEPEDEVEDVAVAAPARPRVLPPALVVDDAEEADDPFAAPTEVVPPGQALAELLAADAGTAPLERTEPFETSAEDVPWLPPAAPARPLYRRWWLWAAVVALGIAIGAVTAKVARRGREDAAVVPADAPTVPAPTMPALAVDAAPVADPAAVGPALAIDAADAAEPVAAPTLDAGATLAPAAGSATTPAGPPRPRTPRGPRPPPPPPPVKCGDEMGIYPPCE
jgi:hypothetical protein